MRIHLGRLHCRVVAESERRKTQVKHSTYTGNCVVANMVVIGYRGYVYGVWSRNIRGFGVRVV